MKKTFIYFLLLASLFTCNEAKQSTSSSNSASGGENSAQPTELKELKLRMEYKTSKEDEFTFMMNDIVIDDLQSKNIHIVEKVSPSTDPDLFTGSFGVNNLSNKLIISLGRKELKEVEIRSVEFTYGDQTVIVAPENLRDYFGFSKFSVLDTMTYKIKTIRVDNQHNPRLYVRKTVWDALKVKF